jgi:hypothetical protein
MLASMLVGVAKDEQRAGSGQRDRDDELAWAEV